MDDGGAYFTSPSSSLDFIHSGAAVLDCVIGGGWPLGRICNIVGDKSTGKTLLAIEALTNFSNTYPKARARYVETEAAFIPEYAHALGLPTDRVDFPEGVDTVEELFDDIVDAIVKSKGKPFLYVLDSLDALTDEAEKKRDIREGTYGASKPKQMSQLFRRLTSRVEKSNVCVIIVSQVRDNIGVTFGRKYSRSGGRALDFYASIVLHLAHLGEIKRTIKGVKRTVGVNIRAKCTKNKIGLPFRECEFPILFSYGIEDVVANLDWLKANKKADALGISKKEFEKLRKRVMSGKLEDSEYREVQEVLSDALATAWREVETSFLPKRRKYR